MSKWKDAYYRDFETFVASECVEGPVVRGLLADLEQAFSAWCAEPERRIPVTTLVFYHFRRWLTARGHFPQQSNGRAYRLRIGVSGSSRFHPNVKAVAS